ncbi:MAG: polysaccharide biosynthesis/export family protein [Pseudomonadota bacterium]
MKKLFSLIFLITCMIGLCIPTVDAQQKDQEALLKKQGQAEVAPNSDQYIIGAEDVLYIHVWKEEPLSKTITVRMDGKISLPLIDEIQAAGLTPLQLREVLTKRFSEFVDSPNVSVMVMEANSFKVFISGQIKKPGVYRLRNETSLLQIISLAEGFTEWADQKEIIIIRKEKGREKRMSVNYKKIISGEDLNSNILLKSGDTIIIP